MDLSKNKNRNMQFRKVTTSKPEKFKGLKTFESLTIASLFRAACASQIGIALISVGLLAGFLN